jgi:hypothetical protein
MHSRIKFNAAAANAQALIRLREPNWMRAAINFFHERWNTNALSCVLVYRDDDATAERRDVMKWITRANVKVDRVACPWLIRTFIDPEAEFLFAPVEQVEGVARKTGAIPYDTAGAELGHHGEECSFDAIVKKYGIKDEAVGQVALIVRGADTRRPDLTPQSPGLEAIAEGFKRLAAAQGYDDHETIRRARHLYDALYLFCGGDPKKLRRDWAADASGSKV